MRTLRVSALCMLFVGILMLVAWLAGYRINTTPSLPRGVYRLVPEPPIKGDLVSFCLEGPYAALAKERGYLAPGVCPNGLRPLLKVLSGLPGDAVTLRALSIKTYDSQGRSLSSALQEGRIPQGMALVLAEHAGSFDGRYFGFVHYTELKRVIPILTF